MKKTAAVFILSAALSICAAGASAMTLEYDGGLHEYDGSIYTLIVNDSVINPPLSPIIFNDHALVPVREIFEELGAEVEYETDTRTVDVIKDDYTVSMAINDNVAYINGKQTVIPDGVAPKLISEYGGETKTMVPVRFISESIGLDVDFNEEHGAILVESSDFDFNSASGENNSSIADPQPQEKAVITSIECTTYGNTLKISVSTDGDIKNCNSFTMQDPGRLVVDMYGTTYNGEMNERVIGEAGIDKVRFGENDERARLVVDSSVIEDYDVEQIDGNQVEITVKTTAAEIEKPNVNTQIPKPSAVPSKPAVTPTPVSTQTPTPTPRPIIGYKDMADTDKLIVLDAGHGGSDSGAVGYLNGNQVLEKNLTLEITNKVKERLEERGYRVSLTRTGDTLPSLVERPTQANEEEAAVFVSIHINSVDNAPSANGTEVYYAESNNGDDYGVNSKKLAENILTRMLYYMGSTNRGVKTAEHAVTKRCDMPASLVEVGFITNPTEVYNMTTEEYQYKVAQGICEGIIITLRDTKIPIYAE